MEHLDYYAELARRLSDGEFAEKFPHLFLVKRPRLGASPGGPITFRTQALNVSHDGLLTDTGRFAEDYWVWPLKKRPLNPFPDRISIGRAPNCDLVFRLSYVSKLHAHILLTPAGHRVVDQGSANGTRLDGVRLVPQVEKPMGSGCKLHLGAMELLVLDAKGFHGLLAREILPFC